MAKREQQLVGWREWVAFPALGVKRIKAKVDTGARTSCLHAFRIEPFTRDDAPWLRFDVHPSQRDISKVLQCEAPMKDRRVVRDSGGHEEYRYVIETDLQIGQHSLPIEVTLTDRDNMKFRVLLGRTAIRRLFVVDPGRSYLTGSRSPRTG
ncbi:MAG: ATP-dependent zinc protease [Halioglobus sp.]|nr:ATP-dependent zinc protease [Halioglobus sp.]